MPSTYEVIEVGLRKDDRPAARCKCRCGNEFIARITDLNRGQVKSCGCLLRKHGMRQHELYGVWHGMKLRCNNPNSRQFKDYGGRGIRICDRWMDFAVFVADVESEIGKRPEGCQLDRIDNSKGYEPGNIKWSTSKQNCRNTRRNRMVTIQGVTKCATEWADEYDLPIQTVLWRINNGKTDNDIIAPTGKNKR